MGIYLNPRNDNNFDEYTILNAGKLSEYTGFTKALDESHIHVTSNRSYNNEDALQSNAESKNWKFDFY